MAGGSSSGMGPPRGSRSRNDALRRLAQLNDGTSASRGTRSSGPAAPIGNEDGLKALGERIDGRRPGGRARVRAVRVGAIVVGDHAGAASAGCSRPLE